LRIIVDFDFDFGDFLLFFARFSKSGQFFHCDW
jgi:hypothetical protein